jgi:predicted nucleic acid-binding protein
MLLLDSDILIDVQRGYPPAVLWFDSLDEPPAVPGLVIMELVQDAKNKKQVREAIALVAPLARVWPTGPQCDQALAVLLQYRQSHGVGLVDALIGACAAGLAATLCTFNVKHYKVIPGLVTLQPYPKDKGKAKGKKKP